MTLQPDAEPEDPTEAALSADPALADWRVLLGRLSARWETGGFSAGAEFVAQVATVADAIDHHPDVDLRYSHVTVTTVSHDVHRLTDRDRRLAAAISAMSARRSRSGGRWMSNTCRR